MNVVRGAVVADGDALALDLFGHRLPIHASHADALSGIGEVEVGIRPQAIQLAAPSDRTILGKVLLCEPLGLEDEFLLQVDDTSLKVVMPASHTIAEGSEVGLRIDPGSIYLFHAGTGETLCCGLNGGGMVRDAGERDT